MTETTTRRIALIFRSGAMVSLTEDQYLMTSRGEIKPKGLVKAWIHEEIEPDWLVVPQEMEVEDRETADLPGVNEAEEAVGRSLTRMDRIDLIWVEGEGEEEWIG